MEEMTMGIQEFVRSLYDKSPLPAWFAVSVLVSFGGCISRSLLQLWLYPGRADKELQFWTDDVHQAFSLGELEALDARVLVSPPEGSL